VLAELYLKVVPWNLSKIAKAAKKIFIPFLNLCQNILQYSP